MLDIVMCTMGKRNVLGLEHVPGEFRLLKSDKSPWAVAANELLDRTENDVLFIDDDIEFIPDSKPYFESIERYRKHAEVMGPAIWVPQKGREARNLWERWNAGSFMNAMSYPTLHANHDETKALYLAHVTASCMFISKKVIDCGIRFPVWRGMHYEDVWFTLDCWQQGFRVAAVPGRVKHYMVTTEAGLVGSTKAKYENKVEQRRVNWEAMTKLMTERNVKVWLEKNWIPNGIREVPSL